MRKKLVSLLIVLVMLLSMAVPGYALSLPGSINSLGSSLLSSISEYTTKKSLRILFGSDDFYNNQWQTARSVSRLSSDIYLLNYDYDYDIDDLLERGVSSTADLLLYCSQHLLDGKAQLKLNLSGFGCSAFTCTTPQGEVITGRNFDYYDSPCMVVWTDPEDGYASVSTVDTMMMLCGDLNAPTSINNSFQVLLAPYIPMDGINEMGLSIGVLEVLADKTDQNTGKPGIVTTAAIRAILDKCATVDEAIALLSEFDMHDLLFICSYHYLISDSLGNSVVVEYINDQMRIIPQETVDGGKQINAVTNFFRSEDGVEDTAAGMVRYDTVVQALTENNGVMTELEAMKLLNSVHLDYPEFLNLYIKTLWSAVYNNSSRTVSFCAGLNYGTIYQFSPTLPGVVSITGEDANISDYVQAPD